MPYGNSRRPGVKLEQRLALVRELEAGSLDRLTCPECRASSVTVRFTRRGQNEYRTWFVCEACAFTMRCQNSRRPRFFSEDRIDPTLE